MLKEKIRSLMEDENSGEACELVLTNIREELAALKADPEYCVIVSSLFLQNDVREKAFDVITLGLMCDDTFYELYLMLGEYYASENINKALLCFYQALYMCDIDEDRAVIEGYIKEAIDAGAYINPVTIVVVTKENGEGLKRCIESIEATVPGGLYELKIEVDDGVGYVRACNRAIKNTNPYHDIMLLDEYSILTENAVFYMTMALYDHSKVGVVGPLTNNVDTFQGVNIGTSGSSSEAEAIRMINRPMMMNLEKRASLSDFALLIKREVLEKTGLLDEDFSPFLYADRDLSMRIDLAGYYMYLCRNSFVYSFRKRGALYRLDEKQSEKAASLMRKKWGFEIFYSALTREDMVSLIDKGEDDRFEVLELGCALGNTLFLIERVFPNAIIHGVEYDENVVRIAGHLADIIQGDVENMDIPYGKESLDYILCGDVLEHLRNPANVIKRFIPYLKSGGCFIASIPNVRHHKVIKQLLMDGRFDYKDAGVLDRTHLKFFTKYTGRELFENCGLEVKRIESNTGESEGAEEFINSISKAFEISDADEMRALQYIYVAKKK